MKKSLVPWADDQRAGAQLPSMPRLPAKKRDLRKASIDPPHRIDAVERIPPGGDVTELVERQVTEVLRARLYRLVGYGDPLLRGGIEDDCAESQIGRGRVRQDFVFELVAKTHSATVQENVRHL